MPLRLGDVNCLGENCHTFKGLGNSNMNNDNSLLGHAVQSAFA